MNDIEYTIQLMWRAGRIGNAPVLKTGVLTDFRVRVPGPPRSYEF